MECQIAMLKTAIDNTATMPMIFFDDENIITSIYAVVETSIISIPALELSKKTINAKNVIQIKQETFFKTLKFLHLFKAK